MKKNEELIVLLARSTAFAGSADGPVYSGEDIKAGEHIDSLIELAEQNGVSPALYLYLEKAGDIPRGPLERLKMQYLNNLRRNARHLDETLRILRELKKAGLRAIPLKGSLMAETLMGDMGIYPTSDIDILVRPEDIEAAVSALGKIGYMVDDQRDISDLVRYWYDMTLAGPDFSVELHWNLLVRYFPVDPLYWWEYAAEESFRGETYYQLSEEKRLIAHVLNVFKHRFYPLKVFTPLQALIRSEAFEWDGVLAEARRIKAEKLLIFTLNLTGEIYDFDLHESIRSKKVAAYSLFRNNILKGLATNGGHPYLRMLLFVLLLDSPLNAAIFVLARIFPPPGEIRLRYGLPAKSKRVYLYYLLNPILIMMRKRASE